MSSIMMDKSQTNILIVDDEEGIRNLIQGILEDEGYRTKQAANSRETYAQIESRAPDLIVLDIWLEQSADDGLQILSKVKANYPHLPIIMISGHGTVETAVSAIKQGAYDFIEKPFKSDRLLLMVRRALEASALKKENQDLKNDRREKRDDKGGPRLEEEKTQSVIYLLDGIDLLACTLKDAREVFEKKYLELQVVRFQGNISKTAEFIGMERSALHRKLKMLGVGSGPNGSNDSDEDETETPVKRIQA